MDYSISYDIVYRRRILSDLTYDPICYKTLSSHSMVPALISPAASPVTFCGNARTCTHITCFPCGALSLSNRDCCATTSNGPCRQLMLHDLLVGNRNVGHIRADMNIGGIGEIFGRIPLKRPGRALNVSSAFPARTDNVSQQPTKFARQIFLHPPV